MKMKEEVDITKEEKDKTIQEEIRNVQTELCSDHRIHMGHIQRLPTDEDDTMSLKDVYVKLSVNESVLENNKIESWTLEHYSEAFHIAEKGSHILVEGEPGMGKTTFVKKVTTDWVDVIENTQENVVQELKEFDLVFVVSLGFVKKNESLASILIDQHGLTIEKENLERILLTHDRILLILDGYDEYCQGTCPQIDAIIQRKHLKKFTVLMTSRPYKSTSFSTTRRLFQHHFQIKGFRTIHEMIEYVQKFFQDERKANSFIPCLENYKLFELSKCPFMLLILCLLFEEEGQSLPLAPQTLIWKLMDWFYRKFLAKRGQCDMSLEEILIKLGKIALKGLLEDQLLFKKDEIEKELGSYVFEIGFLSSKKTRGFTAKNILVSFPHRSIQQYVAGYYLAHSSEGWEALKNISFRKHFFSLELVLQFSVMISNKCLSTALGFTNPLSGTMFDYYSNLKREILDGCTKYDKLPPEINLDCSITTHTQFRLSSHFYHVPVVINSRNFDSNDEMPYSKVLSLNDLTARDIVDESQTILGCDQFDLRATDVDFCNRQFGFVILTDSMVTTIYSSTSEENPRKKILKCIIGCGLEELLILRLKGCNFSMKEIREICLKPKDLKALSLMDCEKTEGLTSQICAILVKHPNLRVLNLHKIRLKWHLVFSILSISGLRSLRALRLYSCDITEDCEQQLLEFIITQKKLTSIDLMRNSVLLHIIPKMVETTPSIINLDGLCLGPYIKETNGNALKAVISGSPNLRQLELEGCWCDVSKEIIEKRNSETLYINHNHLWAVKLAMVTLQYSIRRFIEFLDVGYIHRNIDRLKKLRRFSAMHCYIGDYTMNHLFKNLHENSNLEFIDVSDNPITAKKGKMYRAKPKPEGVIIWLDMSDLIDQDDRKDLPT